MYVPRYLKRNRRPPDRLGYPVAVTNPATKKHKRSRQKRPGTPTRTSESIEASSTPTHTPAARQKDDAPQGAVVSATPYNHVPIGVEFSRTTPEVFKTLPESYSSSIFSSVFGFWLHRHVEYFYKTYRSYCLKNDEQGSPQKTNLGMLKVTVPENGQAVPFEVVSAQYPRYQKLQLLQGLQFILHSPESLVNFTNVLMSTIFLPHVISIVPALQIKLIIFDPKCLPEGPELMDWQEIGVGEDPPASWTLAYKHYKHWMNAVKKLCKLPIVALVTLHFCYPYRNFDHLQSLSKPLRITENLGLLIIDFEGNN
ncbi:hypothetical protein F52700_11981 [Fusarium sp. NRRL 52700]|nr:hypothetical protein F52700_11981 [Fusarium sp. NRRL 52700]